MNIYLNTEKDIRDNDYGAISTIGKNAENGYHLVNQTSDIYTQQYYHKIKIRCYQAW